MIEFAMLITGKEKDIEQIKDIFITGPDIKSKIYRLEYSDIFPFDHEHDIYSYQVIGDIDSKSCADVMLSTNKNNINTEKYVLIDELSKKYNLIIELFSYDSDNYIMEHIVISFGNIDVNKSGFGAIVNCKLKDQWNIEHPDNPITDNTPFDRISVNEYLVGGFQWEYENTLTVYKNTCPI